jgi:ribosomal protein S18 acetylase RimI-like enzyme
MEEKLRLKSGLKISYKRCCDTYNNGELIQCSRVLLGRKLLEPERIERQEVQLLLRKKPKLKEPWEVTLDDLLEPEWSSLHLENMKRIACYFDFSVALVRGVGVIGLIGFDKRPWPSARVDSAELKYWSVHRDFRRKGVGTLLLLERLKEYCVRDARVFMVNNASEQATSILSRLGFRMADEHAIHLASRLGVAPDPSKSQVVFLNTLPPRYDDAFGRVYREILGEPGWW